VTARSKHWSRRQFLAGSVAGAFLGLRRGPAAAEPPPETSTLRIGWNPGVCLAPTYVAEELLRGEGFTDIRYVRYPTAPEEYRAVASGDVDFVQATAGPLVVRLDQGDPILVLAGIHVGCFELFGQGHIRAISDLKGKAVAVTGLGSGRHLLLSIMLAYVGLDHRRDVRFVENPSAEAIRLFAEGKVDAFMAFPPDPQQLRAMKAGHVVVNTALDRPWSQYFCCMLAGNRDFVRAHPIAAKRMLRAVLKATDLCAIEPDRVARFLVDRGYATRDDYALQTLKDVPYGNWRQYDPTDTLRFNGLRLHEAGMIKASPKRIIAQGTDWRFLAELRRELKG
jgi:NitT/TauT family transport system substrate-binding protein